MFENSWKSGNIRNKSLDKLCRPHLITRRRSKHQAFIFQQKCCENVNSPSQPIIIVDSSKGRPRFTNKFLLDHCTKSYQLFAISSEEEYRLMVELNKAFDNPDAVASENNTAVYRVNDQHSIALIGGYFTILNSSGEILDRMSVIDFKRRPRAGFNRIKKLIE